MVAAAPANPPALVPPPGAFQAAVALGEKKANLPVDKIVVMGMMAGWMIGFGAFLAASIGGACTQMAVQNPGLAKMVTGAFGLPFGLLMVLVCGAELFTGNTALVTAAVYEGKATVGQLIKSCTVSYFANFAGSLALVWFVFQTGLFSATSAPVGIAVAKTSVPFMAAFCKGVLCNFLVCIGIWQASAANDLAGKAVGVWFPISAFVALGLEHSVANMFLIPMGIALGAKVTWAQFITANLIPVTLGNIVGGAVFVATMYCYIFGKLGQSTK
eukprot:CAMPEP_0196593298 /NCGR_PEP_ID=MMETSP1081-20130531/75275_1 /TAXON_ID=36882 /ORGANISM="Pyramimonas amylifera, Strain CCMP720" /LENGTH=271 /DNA_ID=CAMNT_0041917245 /DNA_START=295 /DNA_END=1110 /DNA_ORIENTATION=+